MSADLTTPIHRNARESGPTTTDVQTDSMLVLAYLSTVVRELEQRRVAEARFRVESDDGRLSGTVDLTVLSASPELAWGMPTTLEWDEVHGWSALVRCPTEGLARRWLHRAVAAAPSCVAEFVADLAAGRDVGLLYPASCLGVARGRGRRLLADLRRQAAF